VADQDPILGIIAGEGSFPFMVAERAKEKGFKTVAIRFSGHTDAAMADVVAASKEIGLGQLGKLISFFKEHKAEQVVFAGAINKPKAMKVKPDMRAVKVFMRLSKRGDDSLLRAVADEIESEGLRVVSPLALLPELGTPQGVLGKVQPKKQHWDDLRYGWPLAKETGRMDIGQCMVVKNSMVAAVEAMEGTDAAVRRGGELAGPGSTVIKVVKPGQDERIDLPAFGPGTIRSMIEAKATCLGVEAGKSVFFEPEASLAMADKAGIAVVGIPQDFPDSSFDS
jgi:hypothetical protein